MTVYDEIIKTFPTLTPQQATLYSTLAKKTYIAILLTLFLGGLGIQWFYVDRSALGIFSILFCWTFIPLFISIIFLFMASDFVDKCNLKIIRKLNVGNSQLSGVNVPQ